MDKELQDFLGQDNYVTWCISLKRSTERRETFTKWAKDIGMTFQFWEATDYLDLTPEDYTKLCNVHINNQPVSGASACRISITKCLEHFIKQTDKPYLLIFEDDAGFEKSSTSGSTATELSNRESLFKYIRECKEYTKENGNDSWHLIYFGYYDGDVDNHVSISSKYSLLCKSLGTCSTHAMLFNRSVVMDILELLYVKEYSSHPIDEFTKYMMKTFKKTLIPHSTIIGQTDHTNIINYNKTLPQQSNDDHIKHKAGFYSCCSIRLEMIIHEFNENKKYQLPKDFPGCLEFNRFINAYQDITFEYFKSSKDICVENVPTTFVEYDHDDQFKIYKQLDYQPILPFIDKYFRISEPIQFLVTFISEHYNIDYENTCVLFYRGNDKAKETKICSYDEIVSKAYQVLQRNPKTKFLIQSDETDFINYCLHKFPDRSFYLDKFIQHMPKNTNIPLVYDFRFMRYFIAIIVMMAKCHYIICTSGNCSIWMMYYRRHAKNVSQYLEGQWYDSFQDVVL